MALAIGVDVGGTKIAAGVVDEWGKIVAQLRQPTPAGSSDEVASTIAAMAQQLADEHGATSIGIGAAGFVDEDRAQVVFAPNLAWRNEPLKARIEQATGIPTVVENDANAAGWAENRFGAAQDARSAVVLTIGTGVGGAIINNNQLVRGANGFAGELGHFIIRPGGRRCGCGLRGCWERYGSGSALVLEARELASVAPHRAERLLELAGGNPLQVQGHHISQAAREGDPAALDCFETLGDWIGRGMAVIDAILDPDVFVLAGGVAEAGDLLREPVLKSFHKRLTAQGYRDAPHVRLATLGNDAGLIGAADLSRVAETA
ncbi:ROK family glucokinase [Luteococcus sp. Sow4_B9]|uniref:ROK family glucokinase n=1 Tax=Luteococcus sp. Sow4_B9 TaxID=3438792 RepID=UPI003F9C43FD